MNAPPHGKPPGHGASLRGGIPPVIVAALTLALAVAYPSSADPWLALAAGVLASVGTVLTAGVRPCRRRWVFAAGVLAAGAVWAGLDGLSILGAAHRTRSLPTVDLTRGPMPRVTPTYAAIVGYLRVGVHLAEYDVPPGRIPNQSEPPRAVVALVTGTPEDVVTLAGLVVLARLSPQDLPDTDRMMVLEGRVRAADPRLVQALAATKGLSTDHVSTVVVDTLDRPRPAQALGPFVLGGLLLAGAAGCGAAAVGRRRPGAGAGPRHASTPRRRPRFRGRG